MIQRRICVAATAACVALATSIASADGGKSTFTTNLTGYQETPVTINSPGSGEFAAKISKDGSEIQYVLSYRGLTTHVLQSHIHFGRPALTGGIVLFLCGMGWSFEITVGWGRRGFGPLDPVETMRSVIPAATLMAAGSQIAMSSLFAGALHSSWLSRRRA